MRLGKYDLPAQAELRMPGVATWNNSGNQFRVFLLHYQADPEKRSIQWEQQARAGFGDGDWDQEMDLDFGSWTGRPVFRSFSRSLHIAREQIAWIKHSNWPIIMGWDIGIHACVWAQIYRDKFHVIAAQQIVGAFDEKFGTKYKDYEVDCSGLSVFISKCKEESLALFGTEPTYKHIGDPAIANHTITRETKPSEIFRQAGIPLGYGTTQDTSVRVSAVEDWLRCVAQDGTPSFQVDPSALLVIDGMSGGYAYDKRQKPDKGPFSHVCNILEYIATVFPAPRASKEVLAQRAKRRETWDSRTLGSGFSLPGRQKKLPEDWLQQ